jgi:hypothetical protein
MIDPFQNLSFLIFVAAASSLRPFAFPLFAASLPAPVQSPRYQQALPQIGGLLYDNLV